MNKSWLRVVNKANNKYFIALLKLVLTYKSFG